MIVPFLDKLRQIFQKIGKLFSLGNIQLIKKLKKKEEHLQKRQKSQKEYYAWCARQHSYFIRSFIRK